MITRREHEQRMLSILDDLEDQERHTYDEFTQAALRGDAAMASRWHRLHKAARTLQEHVRNALIGLPDGEGA